MHNNQARVPHVGEALRGVKNPPRCVGLVDRAKDHQLSQFRSLVPRQRPAAAAFVARSVRPPRQ